MPEVSCMEYTESGFHHSGCVGPLTPASIMIKTSEAMEHCWFFNREDCQEQPNDIGKGATTCYYDMEDTIDGGRLRPAWWERKEGQVRSFRCEEN